MMNEVEERRDAEDERMQRRVEEQDVNNESNEAKGTKIDRRDQGAGNDNYCN